MDMLIFYSLFFLIVGGLFGDEVKSVSVKDGDSLTLHTHIVKQPDDMMVWYYGPNNTFVARINGKANSSMLSNDERFEGRVMLDNQTGDLNITNITTQHNGVYTLKISRNNEVSYKKFNVTVYDVFGDEVKSVSVMESESVTLHTDTEIQTDDLMVWFYGPENTFVARVNGKVNSRKLSDDERYRDRVMLDYQTGDLTITNITTQHTGDYKLEISNNNDVSYKKFNVTVYAHLPVPVISRDSSQCSSSSSSSSNCSLLCSVLNVRDVSLSWYKGNSLLSIISVSDLNIRLSLPLEVEYQDTNTYRCVLNNTITNQTQHLNITQLCQTCSDTTDSSVLVIIISVVLALVLCVIIIIIIICVYKHKRAHRANHKKTSYAEVTGEGSPAPLLKNEQQKSYMHVLPD